MSKDRVNRIVTEFDIVRNELLDEISVMDSDEFDWVPRPGMRSIRGQLDEIGRTEKVVLEYVRAGNRLKWDDAITWTGDNLSSYLDQLQDLRADLKDHLGSFVDEDLDKPITLPDSWQQYWGRKEIPREEYFRWLIRHEYYHFGQIIVLLWTLGKNPYERNGNSD